MTPMQTKGDYVAHWRAADRGKNQNTESERGVGDKEREKYIYINKNQNTHGSMFVRVK